MLVIIKNGALILKKAESTMKIAMAIKQQRNVTLLSMDADFNDQNQAHKNKFGL